MSEQKPADPPGLVTTPGLRRQWEEEPSDDPLILARRVRHLLADLNVLLVEHAGMRERLARYDRERSPTQTAAAAREAA